MPIAGNKNENHHHVIVGVLIVVVQRIEGHHTDHLRVREYLGKGLPHTGEDDTREDLVAPQKTRGGLEVDPGKGGVPPMTAGHVVGQGAGGVYEAGPGIEEANPGISKGV